MNHTLPHLRIAVGITGASGSVYAEKLIDELIKRVPRVYCILSNAGKQVCQFELKKNPDSFSLLNVIEGRMQEPTNEIVRVFGHQDLFAPIASGSSAPTHMIIIPCSMGSLAKIAHGMSSNLLERCADVMLKQKRPLIICPRETPMSTVHLRNMITLSELGAHIVPLMPGFYHKPKNLSELVDFMVGKVLELLDYEHSLYKQWNTRMK